MTRSRVLAAVTLIGALVLTGCSEEAENAADRAQEGASQAVDDASEALKDVELPDVDWDKYGNEAKERIDSLADQADCEGLEKLAQDEANDTEVTAYIKAKIRQAC